MKITKYLLIAYTVFFFQFSIAQTPCVNGFADVYPCNDYGLLSNVPISVLANTSGNPEGSDIWGWTDPTTSKEYAIVATTNSTAFVDISDPINPIFLGRLDSENGNTNVWRDVKVYNNYAFIVADNVGNHGMQVFDLTKLRNITSPPITFTADTVFTGVGSCHNIVINEQLGYAYLVGCNTYNGGPTFIDISNPLNPLDVGGYSADGYTHDAQVITYNGPDTDYIGNEILVASNGTGSGTDKIVLIDVTDKGSPQFISEVTYPNSGYAHQGWFTDDHRYFLFGDEQDEIFFGNNTRTIVLDFLDLDNPIISSTYEGTTGAIDHNGYVNGDLFYLANYRAGLRILDISNIGATTNSMTEVGYFDTYPANDNVGFSGAWSVYPYFQSGNIIIGDIDRGLFVINKNSTLSNYSIQSDDFSYTISPNPIKKNSSVKIIGNNLITSVRIVNTLGQIVFEQNNTNTSEFVLTLDFESNGVYFVTINNITTKKLLVE